MEKLQWFKFSPTDWKMGKIQRLPPETQVRFISLLCLYWNKECILSYDDAEVEIDKEHIEALVSKRVVKVDNGFVIIEFLNEQFVESTSSKINKSISGKVGNLKRWNTKLYKRYISGEISLDKALEIAYPSHTDSEPIATQSQSIAEESREEENINSNLSVNWDGLLKQFNQETKKQTRVIPDKAKKQIVARLKEGFTKGDILKAIINCYNDPYHKETGHKFLTLEFISRADKLDKYSTMVRHKENKKDREGML